MHETRQTIYIDIDDEITAMIDKVKASTSPAVALVLPKRAAVLQSVVNMKLLKKAADQAHKKVVLITSEAGLMPLAGAADVAVAKNLQATPEVPSSPETPTNSEALTATVPAVEESVDKTKPVGELSGDKKPIVSPKKAEDTIEVDNETPAAEAHKPAKAGKGKKTKKVPNFEKFRLRLFLAIGGLIVLVLIWFLGFFFLPKASILISTDTTPNNASITFTASPNTQTVNTDSSTVPDKEATMPKNDSQTAPATGQQDTGALATGSVSMSATKCSGNPFVPPESVPAGSTVTQNSLSYQTSTAVSFHGTGTSGSCYTYSGDSSTGITAQAKGSNYNTSSASFAVSGRSDVSASGSASGGSSNIVKIVAQADVDSAKSKLTSNDASIKSQLQQSLQSSGYTPMPDTYVIKGEQVVVSPNVGQQGDNVTVTDKGTYSMVGVRQSDLKQIIDNWSKTNIDLNNQQIQDYGLNNAVFKIGQTDKSGNITVTLDTQLTIGPKINTDSLKVQVAGKKRGETESLIKALPGVKDVQVHYSPFWVSSTPKKVSKITITFQKAN